MSKKTNAIRLIEQAKLAYRECFYEYSDQDSVGTHAADAIGMPPEQVFKTLVAHGSQTGILVFCIPACSELNLKKAATVSGNKKIELISVKDLLNLTGYIRGGCSPIGMKKQYTTYLDETAVLWDEISVSAGERGHMIFMQPEILAEFIHAEFVDII